MLGSFTGAENQRILINFNKPYFSLANINLGANYFMQTSFSFFFINKKSVF